MASLEPATPPAAIFPILAPLPVRPAAPAALIVLASAGPPIASVLDGHLFADFVFEGLAALPDGVAIGMDIMPAGGHVLRHASVWHRVRDDLAKGAPCGHEPSGRAHEMPHRQKWTRASAWATYPLHPGL